MNNAVKILGALLIVGGVLTLAYGGFTYVEDTHDAQIGPIEISVKDKETVNIPVWVGVTGLIAGAALLVVRMRS